jgi:hypothetical protein
LQFSSNLSKKGDEGNARAVRRGSSRQIIAGRVVPSGQASPVYEYEDELHNRHGDAARSIALTLK